MDEDWNVTAVERVRNGTGEKWNKLEMKRTRNILGENWNGWKMERTRNLNKMSEKWNILGNVKLYLNKQNYNTSAATCTWLEAVKTTDLKLEHEN